MGKVFTAKDLNLDDDPDNQIDPDKDKSTDLDTKSGKDITIGTPAEEDETGEKKFIFANQEEAEKAYQEARKKMQEATTEASKLKKIQTDLDKRAAAARTTETINTFDIERKKIISGTIGKVQSISLPKEDDPEYAKKMEVYNQTVAEIWMEGQTFIAQTVLAEEKQRQDDIVVVQKEINKKLKDAGLDKIPKINEIFRILSSEADADFSIDQQIDDTIERCKEYVESIRSDVKTRATEEEKERKRLETLGRGGKFRATSETEKPNASMREAQDKALDHRRVGKTK